jgi:predicted Zn-dependent peptidase
MNTTDTHLLPNGLRIIGERIDWVQGATIGFVVKTGARDEQPSESGVSHFLEHMLFKGTRKRTSLQLSFDMGAIGAKANAFTSEEHTVYYASVVGKYVPDITEILSDMLRSTIPAEEFDMEKKVILEEIALYQDRPLFWLFEQASSHFYQSHPAGNSVLGTVESVSAITRDQMVSYFDRRYSPTNIVLVATGNIDWKKVCEDAEHLCGNWEPYPATRETPPFSRKGEQTIFHRAHLQQGHLLFATPGCPIQDDTRYALKILAMMIGDSMGSRLYWDLIDSGLAESAGADNESRDGVGSFSLYASTRPSDIPVVREKILAILGSLMTFSDDDLQRAKNKALSHLIVSGENTMGRMVALGQTWTYLNKLHSIEEAMNKITMVDRSAIEKALIKYPLQEWCEYQLLPE